MVDKTSFLGLGGLGYLSDSCMLSVHCTPPSVSLFQAFKLISKFGQTNEKDHLKRDLFKVNLLNVLIKVFDFNSVCEV